uniref:ATP synthase complex subunit 8 n=1 Tax=Phrynoderma karaavali TaxID=2967234 RepID=A0A1S6Q732_9NEOB|nr:ATP synthase F0 subunit 8 [Phrynoderma karaavali]
MPQLMPDPWYAIFLFTWTTFLIFSPTKILPTQFLNDPHLPTHTTQTDTWTWTW